MKQTITEKIQEAVAYLSSGKIIAYPTEAVYGLGCNPFNQEAVNALISLKGRSESKGLISIASNWRQIQELIQPVSGQQLEKITKTWPGPTTWVFPASQKAPAWLLGDNATIAVRITDHPIAKQLCDAFQGPIISTSANLSGQPPAKTALEVVAYFNHNIAFILKGKIGGLVKPTQIYDVVTGKLLRG
jgi:L-threonylcarbamoyladenylate synthase